MWIEKTKSGFRMVERVRVCGKFRKVSVAMPQDTPKARKTALYALQNKISHISPATGKSTEIRLSEACEEYINDRQLKGSSAVTMRSEIRGIIAIIGDGIVSDYTAPELRHLFSACNYAPKRLNALITRFKAVSRWLYEMDYTAENLGEKLRPVKVSEPKKDPSTLYLEPDRLAEILAALDGMCYYATRFLVLTGCRVGEMAALTPEDIGDRYITINKSFAPSVRKITTPKSASSIREIYIQKELQEFLREYGKWRKLNMVAYGLRPITYFYNSAGGILTENLLLRKLRPLGIHPHTLRHTHISLLAAQGLSLEEIARRVGHENSKITKEIYLHITQRQKEQEEARISEIRLLRG